MNIRKRQMIGVALMAASVLVAILIQAFTGRVLEFHTVHEDRLSSGMVVAMGVIIFHWRYAIPLAAAFIVGLLCCAWPTRKPPRIV